MSDTIRMDQIAPASGLAAGSVGVAAAVAAAAAAAAASGSVFGPTSASMSALGPGSTSGKPGESMNSNSNSGRKDLEGLYFALKSALADRWNDYKAAIASFVLGRINRQELQRRIGPVVTADPATVNYHNRLICAICYNCSRDAPDPGVAVWVSATEKPSGSGKMNAGDQFEHRLRAEVMQLPTRERHRLKNIKPAPYDRLVEAYAAEHASREIHLPEVGATTSLSKTNWEPEIRKRYTQPLAVEASDLPDTEGLRSRITPICYEEAISAGCSTSCADFVDVALKSFLEGALTHLFQRTRSNGSGFVRTARFAKRLEREEDLCARDELLRNADGLLPVEAEAISKRQPLSLADLQMSIRLGDPFFGRAPVLSHRLLEMNGATDEDDEDEPTVLVADSTGISVATRPKPTPVAVAAVAAVAAAATKSGLVVNGVHPLLKKPHHHLLDVEMADPAVESAFLRDRADLMDDDDDEMEDLADGFSWQGARMEDIATLNGVLDDCIAV